MYIVVTLYLKVFQWHVTLYLKVFQWHVLSELWMPRKGGKGQGQRLGASESLAVEEERSRQSYKGL